VGIAGLKDARGLTRQWMSLERVDADRAAKLHLPNIKILTVTRHRNKLKIGHLRGNRFEIRIRDCRTGAKAAAERTAVAARQVDWGSGAPRRAAAHAVSIRAAASGRSCRETALSTLAGPDFGWASLAASKANRRRTRASASLPAQAGRVHSWSVVHSRDSMRTASTCRMPPASESHSRAPGPCRSYSGSSRYGKWRLSQQ
jgi:hypothetical protein